MIMLLALPVIAAVALAHRYLVLYAPSNVLIRRVRATAPALRTAAALLAVALLGSTAGAKDEFLRPDVAYRHATRVEGDRIVIAWTIEPGYYLYKKKMGVASSTPGVQLGEPLWPKGEDHTDEYFGTQEIYRGKVEVPVPFTAGAERPSSADAALAVAGTRIDAGARLRDLW